MSNISKMFQSILNHCSYSDRLISSAFVSSDLKSLYKSVIIIIVIIIIINTKFYVLFRLALSAVTLE